MPKGITTEKEYLYMLDKNLNEDLKKTSVFL